MEAAVQGSFRNTGPGELVLAGKTLLTPYSLLVLPLADCALGI